MKANRHQYVKKAVLIGVLLVLVITGSGLLAYRPAYRFYRSSISKCMEWGNAFIISDQHLSSLLAAASDTAKSTAKASVKTELIRIGKEQREDRVKADQSGINRPGGCEARQLPSSRLDIAKELARLTARSERRIKELHDLSTSNTQDSPQTIPSMSNKDRLGAIIPGLEDLLANSRATIGEGDQVWAQLKRDLTKAKMWVADQSQKMNTPDMEATLYKDADEIIQKENHSRGIDCRHQSCLALTFDDGPDPSSTSPIINTLFTTKTPATFFPIGQKVKPPTVPLLTRLTNAGYPIGNHTWSHQDLPDIIAKHEEQKELEESGTAIQNASGRRDTMIRPPHGRIDEASRTYIMNHLGAAIVIYNVDSYDWAQGATEGSLSTKIKAEMEPGSIVLMHDSQPHTSKALPKLLQDLKKEGYRLVTIPELTGEYPRAGTIYYSRTNILRP